MEFLGARPGTGVIQDRYGRIRKATRNNFVETRRPRHRGR